MALVSLLATFGMPEALTYFVASRRLSPGRALTAGVATSFVAGLLSCAGLIAAAPVLLRQSPGAIPLLQGLALLVPVFLVGSALRGTVQGHGDFHVINLERWFSVGTRLLFIAAAAALGMLTVASAAWITNLTAIVALSILAVGIVRRHESSTAFAHPTPAFRPLVSYGSRVWLGSISVLLIMRLDQVVMAPIVEPVQLGFYAVAVAVGEIPAAAFTALRDIIFARGSQEEDNDLIGFAARASCLLFIPIVAVIALLTPLAVTVVFGEEFRPAAPMAQILLVAALPAGLASVFGAGLMSQGRPGVLSLAQASVGAVSVLLVLAFAAPYGGLGAALASLASYVLLMVVTFTLFIRISGQGVRNVLVPTRADASRLKSQLQRIKGG